MADKRQLEELGLKELIAICDKRGLDSSSCESKAEVIDLLLSHTDKQEIEGEITNASQKPRSYSDSDNDYRQTSKQSSTNSNISTPMEAPDFPNSSRYRFTLTNTIPVNSSTEKTFTV